MEQANIVEGQDVAGTRFEGVAIGDGQANEKGVGLIPRKDLLERHIEVTVPLRHAVIYPRVSPSSSKLWAWERGMSFRTQ